MVHITVAFLFASGAVCLGADRVRQKELETGARPRHRQVRYGLTVQNMTGDLLPLARLFLYLPLEETAFQKGAGYAVSHAYERVDDPEGNRVICVTMTNLAPYAARIVTVEANILLRDTPAVCSLETDRFLRPGRLIESKAAAFDSLAPQIKRETELETVRALFDWVRRRVKMTGYVGQDHGALYALQKRRGDCTEMACLFAALCRRHGIPARVMGGIVCENNVVIRPRDYHNWAEFYLDGRWQLADPQQNRFQKDAWQYVAFSVLGDGKGPVGSFPRFRYEGTGLKVRMN